MRSRILFRDIAILDPEKQPHKERVIGEQAQIQSLKPKW